MAELGGPWPAENARAAHRRRIGRRPGRRELVLHHRAGSTDRRRSGTIGVWASEWAGEPISETGWMVLPDHQGKGYASAALAAILERARADDRWGDIHAFPGVTNGASNALCRKFGFEQLEDGGDADYAGRHFPVNHWVWRAGTRLIPAPRARVRCANRRRRRCRRPRRGRGEGGGRVRGRAGSCAVDRGCARGSSSASRRGRPSASSSSTRANNLGLVEDISFSPYHLVGYAALLTLAVYVVWTFFRALRRGGWRTAFPPLYGGLGSRFVLARRLGRARPHLAATLGDQVRASRADSRRRGC